MKQTIGKVIEVFIPKEYKNNEIIDIMESKNIGFKVETKNEIIEVIEAQDERNCNILKDDKVLLTKQIISGKEYIDIELYEGEDYE